MDSSPAPGRLFAPSPTGKPEQAVCQFCSKSFLIIAQEQNFYLKKDLPWPVHCPECRQKRRLSLRNERKLYRRRCDKCQKEIISTYSPESQYKVYCQECFWQDIG